MFFVFVVIVVVVHICTAYSTLVFLVAVVLGYDVHHFVVGSHGLLRRRRARLHSALIGRVRRRHLFAAAAAAAAAAVVVGHLNAFATTRCSFVAFRQLFLLLLLSLQLFLLFFSRFFFFFLLFLFLLLLLLFVLLLLSNHFLLEFELMLHEQLVLLHVVLHGRVAYFVAERVWVGFDHRVVERQLGYVLTDKQRRVAALFVLALLLSELIEALLFAHRLLRMMIGREIGRFVIATVAAVVVVVVDDVLVVVGGLAVAIVVLIVVIVALLFVLGRNDEGSDGLVERDERGLGLVRVVPLVVEELVVGDLQAVLDHALVVVAVAEVEVDVLVVLVVRVRVVGVLATTTTTTYAIAHRARSSVTRHIEHRAVIGAVSIDYLRRIHRFDHLNCYATFVFLYSSVSFFLSIYL